MHQDHHRVKIPSDVLGNDSPSLQPPLPSGGKGVIGDKEIGAGPRSEARPNLLCKTAVEKQVGAVFRRLKTQGVDSVGRPISFLQIVRRKATTVHHEPHEEFAAGGGGGGGGFTKKG